MAKAEAVPPVKREIVLTLSEEEAETLHRITMKVGGHSSRTRRKHADAIREALISVGVKDPVTAVSSGQIMFEG